MNYKIDYSKLPSMDETAKSVLSMLESSINENMAAGAKQAKPVADAAKRTGEIAMQAISDVLAKKIDLIGAERVARRAIDQSIDLAKAGANLAAVTSLNTLREFALSVLKIAPKLFGVG